jgi:sugar phosphate isomerase/epimerase
LGAIKRGVSLYSLQDEYARKRMTLEEIFIALKTMGVGGIEVLSDQMIHGSPHPTGETVAAWQKLMEKYGFESVCNDIFVNSTLYRNRRLTLKEQEVLLKDEIINAHNLGFKLVRLVSDTNALLVEPLLPIAEKYDVAMALEIHGGKSFGTVSTKKYLEVMMKLNSPYVGIIPDMGLFCSGHPRIAREYYTRFGLTPAVGDYIDNIFKNGSDAYQLYGVNDPHDRSAPIVFPDALRALFRNPLDAQYAAFATMYENTPFTKLDPYISYIKNIHGKFYEMTEGNEETSVQYEEFIGYLTKKGWNGYICSEYEGNRLIPPEQEVEGLEQVRRHQEMLKKYTGR